MMPPMRQLQAIAACHTSSDAQDVLRSEKAALRRLVKSRLKQLSEEQMAHESTRLRLAPTPNSLMYRSVLWVHFKVCSAPVSA